MLSALIHLVASYTYTYTTSAPLSPAESGALGSMLILTIIMSFFFFALIVVLLVAMWKLYVKAGKAGWAVLVPFYNSWVLAEIAGKPGWWGLYPLLAIVPFVGFIAVIVVSVIIALGIAHNFGKSDAFGIFALWLFSFVGYLILGYGSATYTGSTNPQQPAAPAPAPAAPGTAQ